MVDDGAARDVGDVGVREVGDGEEGELGGRKEVGCFLALGQPEWLRLQMKEVNMGV